MPGSPGHESHSRSGNQARTTFTNGNEQHGINAYGSQSGYESGIDGDTPSDVMTENALPKARRNVPFLDVPMVKTPFDSTNSPRTRNRLKDSDYDIYIGGCIEDAQAMFRERITNGDAFPDHQTEADFIKAAWNSACPEGDTLNSIIENVIKSGGSQMRGEVKDKARTLVALHYGVEEVVNGPDEKRLVRERTEHLLDRQSFIYKDPITRKGVFMHITIQTVINNVWFHNRNADGVILQDDYCKPNMGVSPFMIALVSAAIGCCLDEWATGERKAIQFSAAMYQDKYRAHCNLLSAIEAKKKGSVRKLCIKIMKDALKHAETNDHRDGEIQLDDDELEAAAMELDNLPEDEA